MFRNEAGMGVFVGMKVKRLNHAPRLVKALTTPLKALLMVAAVATLWVIFIQWKMVSLPDGKLPPKEVGIVLGAALWQSTPSPALQERLNRAVLLYEEGTIKRIIVSGGYDHANSKLTEAEGMRNYLLDKGVRESDIYLENAATSTYENMLFSQNIMKQNGWTSSVIVTHRYHAVRALDIARFLGYEDPEASPMDSNVLIMSWHKGRETLALTKWQWDKVMLALGQQTES
ncbi:MULTISPECIES: YdcF family protein [unclassified Paenibacillus]|uniref:SanA/YdcF family protein n=1 Tax=unclassified Paenibacillus TaxID=185978 RepID=UPI001B3D6BAF|nr:MULTISPECIES: YdcF family protein [unclassified Paenibacillus]MBP1155444.1 vancomycin permeability regulator SanA [Paenibacillus sp. PvP091]MBP1169171.1 vancomycin permeability regulator SanA [Paenibacillus sp. PvR098]MBP2440199.1 vancomycin permeability regulator SanA [Paenibacillus sp. PvP052]